MFRRLTLSALFVAATLAPEIAHARSCRFPPDAKTAAEGSTDVFEATISGVRFVDAEQRQRTFTLDVGRVMKGAAAKQVELTTNTSSAACGRQFEKGVTYLVYARRGEAGLTDNQCSFTATKKRAAQRGDYEHWGAGPDGVSAPPAEPPPTPPQPVDATPFEPRPGEEPPAPTTSETARCRPRPLDPRRTTRPRTHRPVPGASARAARSTRGTKTPSAARPRRAVRPGEVDVESRRRLVRGGSNVDLR